MSEDRVVWTEQVRAERKKYGPDHNVIVRLLFPVESVRKDEMVNVCLAKVGDDLSQYPPGWVMEIRQLDVNDKNVWCNTRLSTTEERQTDEDKDTITHCLRLLVEEYGVCVGHTLLAIIEGQSITRQ